MKEDILNKILKIDRPRSISINIHDISLNHFYDVELKNTITHFKSSIKPNIKDLFFEHFPYQSSKSLSNEPSLPTMFFETSNTPKYLIAQNTEIPIQEHSPYLDYVKRLNFFGSLKQRKNKSVYLEIDDFFMNLISQSLDASIEKTDDLNINVISKDEHERFDVFPIFEIGEKFQFKIKNLYSVNIDKEDSIQRIWFLEIESKDLQEFRYKYHLFEKINARNFLIPLGKKKSFKLKKSFPLMIINITFFAA